MRICYLGDASSIHTQRWVEWFAARHEVAVISTTPLPGLERHRLGTLPGPESRLRLFRSIRATRRAILCLEPDLVHCHFINEAGWFGAAADHHPLVITAWGSDLYRAPHESRLARYLNPWSLRRADHVTCDSHAQATVIRRWGVPEERLDVIGWGVDRAEFHPGVDGARLRACLGVPGDAPTVLSPRRWHPNCNIPAVIDAHAKLPDGIFLLLKRFTPADRGVAEAVDGAVDSSPAADRIRFVDELGADELPELYAAADVVVSLCETDGTPVSVLEAMATGRAVVALENASLAEWVSEPGGVLVPRPDPELVADALRPFLDDGILRARAREHNVAIVACRADRNAEFERMDAIYHRLADDRGGAR